MITDMNLFLMETIKYTRNEQECLHLQEALRVIFDILSDLNDVIHSTQIVGYSDNLNTLGLPNMSSNGEKAEQRRAEMKQRSASLDHPAYSHRRHLQHRATVTIRTPDSDDPDDESLLPGPIIDLNKTNIKRNTKLLTNNSIARL
ncbi:unnamed protein product [Adineta steineri]|uniref:Uncharacterized protein n=2 Tax=Adineta steineri TaxID=433720 RepID=A0A813ZVU4_9BILA|nr:unnamed protein product [Adineta steineri]CAF0903320.1 unnamed protein product [Adineta steineri]CAF3841622.1 unnamed protein product [Adineta steineri]